MHRAAKTFAMALLVLAFGCVLGPGSASAAEVAAPVAIAPDAGCPLPDPEAATEEPVFSPAEATDDPAAVAVEEGVQEEAEPSDHKPGHPVPPPKRKGFCRCGCGIGCTTDADCGPGGSCDPFVTCC